MVQKEMTAPAVPAEAGQVEPSDVALPMPDLSLLAEQPAVVDEPKEGKPKPQELAETSAASVGLVVGLVVVSIVAAVVLAMWMVSPLMALLLGIGLIVAAVLAGAAWLAWRKYLARRGRQSRTQAGERPARGPVQGRGRGPGGGSLWPFGRGKSSGGPAGRGTTGGGKPTAGGKTASGPTGRGGGSLWPFGRGKSSGGPAGRGTGGGKPTTGGKTASGPTGRGGGSLWPFGGRGKNAAGPAGRGATGGGKGTGGAKPTGGGSGKSGRGEPGGGKAGRSGAKAGESTLGQLLRLAARKARAKNDTGGKDGKARRPEDQKQGGKDGSSATGRVRPTPGGHRPETVIEVELDDITAPVGRPVSEPGGPRVRTSAPRQSPPPGPGPAAGRGAWFDERVPATPLRDTPHPHQCPVPPVSHLSGGPEMSTTTTGEIDQDAMRVANRYAGLIAKHETLLGRANACREAAVQYRRDARENAESAENHRMAARTIRDRDVAAAHARQAREAEAEAAREILAARYYEEQAEEYEAQARAIGF